MVGHLVLSNNWTCPDNALMYTCTVIGRPVGSTVWRGSAFNCTNVEIVLQHKHFTSENGVGGVCNDGAIVAQTLRVDSEQHAYISQLTVNLTSQTGLFGKNVECIYDDVGSASIVGSCIITNFTENHIIVTGKINHCNSGCFRSVTCSTVLN